MHDRFCDSGAGFQYLSLRNQHGAGISVNLGSFSRTVYFQAFVYLTSYNHAGHSRQEVDGHAQFMQGIKPAMGYNGSFGYRRNTPWLRAEASPFGTASRSPTH